MLANLERNIAAESKQPETSEIRVTIRSEPAAGAPSETALPSCPPEN
jgi:hypothetical protein